MWAYTMKAEKYHVLVVISIIENEVYNYLAAKLWLLFVYVVGGDKPVYSISEQYSAADLGDGL